MKLKRIKLDSGLERQFLIGFITSDQFVARTSAALDTSLIPVPHFRQVIKWCVDFHEKYRRAPGKDIEGVYYAWAEREGTNPTEAEAVFELLGSLSKKYESQDQNVDYLVEQFKKYMLGLKLASLKDSVAASLQQDDLDDALRQIDAFRSHPTGASTGINPFADRAVWEGVYAEAGEPLFTLPGAAGAFLGPALAREGLLGIQAPEKRGKTFWCIEFAMRAILQRRRVAFFSTGDLSQNQMLRRLAVRIENVPMYSWQCGKENPVRVPVGIRDTAPEGPVQDWLQSRIDYKTRVFKQPITQERTITSMARFVRGMGVLSDSNYFMLSCHATKSINVRQIDGILNGWEYELGFIPDVVIIDYADILAPENERSEYRNQINETWSAMRRLSQEKRALLITPTQANAKSYNVQSQGMGNFSEDKRKNAHVTGMLTLNQNESERKAQIMRLGLSVARESPFGDGNEVVVGICPALGRMLCFSESLKRFRELTRDNSAEAET